MKEDLKDARILIIDDTLANIEVLENLLMMKGYTNVKSLSDSTQALSTIKEFEPELILLDLMMPQVSGFDIMEELKKVPSGFPLMRILVLTADITPESKKKALSGGASDFLTKPFDLTEVDLRIRNPALIFLKRTNCRGTPMEPMRRLKSKWLIFISLYTFL
jgi:two-component system sensor histidine kinase/response regulator